MKIVTILLAAMTVAFTFYGIADAITARIFQTYSRVTAIVTSTEPATYNISSRKKRNDYTSSNETYSLSAYQTIKVLSAREADKNGSLLHTFLYVIVVDIIMAIILVIMVKIFFCKPDKEVD